MPKKRYTGFMPPRPPFGFGAYVAVVRIDRDTRAVVVDRLVAVDDCGTVLNPLILEGQLYGALAQGIGQALAFSQYHLGR